MGAPRISFEPETFAELEGWAGDDHAAAFVAFCKSAPRVIERATATSTNSRPQPSEALLKACRRACELSRVNQGSVSGDVARQFFEENFTPYRLSYEGAPGILTGYYEPELSGARRRSDKFFVPVYARPDDLVNLIDEAERGARAGERTHARRTAEGLKPYFTRAEIDQGALEAQGLELLYVEDPIDLFFMQVQGSGLIRFEDGSTVRLTYAGKNGFDYTSIGRFLIDNGLFPSEDMTLQALIDWLKADPIRARDVMWKNESYVFFKELGPVSESATLGVDDIALSPGRSIAVDTAFHEIGTPIFVRAPRLTHADDSSTGFNRLMIAQDVGSAIKGPERGDLFFGTGLQAGQRAGQTKHEGRFIVLLPNGPRAARSTSETNATP